MTPHKHQKHNRVKIANVIIALAFTVSVCFTKSIYAQQYRGNGLSIEHFDSLGIVLSFSMTGIDMQRTDDGQYLLTSTFTNSYSREAGRPMLPQLQTMIALPSKDPYTIVVVNEEWDSIGLEQLGIATGHEIAAAPAARIKDREPEAVIPDATVYGVDSTYGPPVVSLTALGSMRGTETARLTISPVRYNSARRHIEVCRQLNVRILFTHSENGRLSTHPADNPMLNRLPIIAAGRAGKAGSKEYSNSMCLNESPITYMVVAPERFSQTLKPFIKWKREEGYIVEEHMCDGETNEQIHDFLQARYDSASEEHPAPLFILLVGDVADIPVWVAQQHIQDIDVHRTDMFYAEFTGDYLPDAILGRISANDTIELKNIIDKTLAYERFRLPDSSYLNRLMLVAGKEKVLPAPAATNGQVNRLKEIFTDFDPLLDTICYYNPASDLQADDIMSNWRTGVGYVNYSAHCKYFGWSSPLITSSHIDELPSDGHFFLSINNCCRANAFVGDCFGEHLLRLPGGGAIGVIGATNETLWDEDYHWSIGTSGAPQMFPQYDSMMPGALDRLMHTHGEPTSTHVTTQGQIVVAGNWAVTASGSPYDAFYWEIYTLLGDPSLMPYIGIPSDQALATDSMAIGDSTVTIHGTPGARIAATWNDTLYGICTIDTSGHTLMRLSKPFHGNILFTATAQFHKPRQHAIIMHPDDTLLIETAALQNYKIYPNPTSNTVTIEGFDGPTQIVILDIYGRPVIRATAEANTVVQQDISMLAKGIYSILFISSKKENATAITHRLIIR